jgi:signal transduction histidine kinase
MASCSRSVLLWVVLPLLPLKGAPLLLTDTAAVRGLRPEQAAQQHLVRLDAVVTYRDGIDRNLFVQDEFGGIFVSVSRSEHEVLRSLEVGDRIRLEGVTQYQRFSPSISGGGAGLKITPLGAGALPEAPLVTAGRVQTGEFHDQYVSVRSVIRSMSSFAAKGEHRVLLSGSSETGLIEVWIHSPSAPSLPEEWLNQEAIFIGVAAGGGNDHGQIRDVRLMVPSLDRIKLDTNALAQVFSRPPLAPGELLRYEPPKSSAHPRERAHVRGFVTLVKPGKGVFLGDDGGNGVWVESAQQNAFARGDELSVAGYAARDGGRIFLRDGVLRPTGSRASLRPAPARVGEILRGAFPDALVRVQAALAAELRHPGVRMLSLDADGRRFFARLLDSCGADTNPQWAVGSLLELVGVSEAYPQPMNEAHLQTDFTLLLQGADSVTLLGAPPWFTRGRLLMLAGVLAAVAALGALWVLALNRQLARQTRLIERQTARRTTIEERQRIARELHDSLEQQLAGLSIQLDDAGHLAAQNGGAPSELVSALGNARAMLRHSRAEARRSILDLRTQALETGGLVGALWLPENSGGVAMQIVGEPRPLPRESEFQLLRIAGEAVANARRHASGAAIQLRLEYTTEAVRLAILDDGPGFDPHHPPVGRDAHFGLLGMRERAEKLGATFHLHSAPGSGTRIEVCLSTASA